MSSACELLRAHPRHLLAAAVALGLALGWRSVVAFVALLLVLVALALAARFRTRLAVALLLALLAATLLAELRLAVLDRSNLTAAIGHAVVGEVTLTQAPRANSFGWSALARLRGESVLVRGDGRSPELTIGDLATAAGSLKPLGDGDRWLAVQHVRAILRLRSIRPTGRQRSGFEGLVDGIRRRATTALSSHLPAAEAGLLRGMTLGDDSAMPTNLRDAMRRSGLGHLVAASGANIALLVLLVFTAGAALAAPRSMRLLLALIAIAVYVPLAGSGASIERAGVMGAAGLIAAMASRPTSRWYALLLAAVVTLTLDPLASEQAGWQLSFAAVVAIALFSSRLRSLAEGLGIPSLLSEPLALTGAATLGTAPVAAATFGTLSLVSLPANLAAALLVAPITWLGMVAALAGQLSVALAEPLTWLAYWPLAALTAIARVSSALPAAQVAASGPAVAAGCGALALLVGFGRERRYAIPIGALCGLLLAAFVLLSGRRDVLAAPPVGTVRVSFLDVGQGDATLLQSGDHAALIDSGPPDAGIVELLGQSGVERLDLLVATHAQADHLGGADEVLGAFPVRCVLDGRDGVEEPQGAAMAASARRHHVPLITPAAGQMIRVGSITFEVMWPPGGSTAPPSGDPNQRAIVITARAPGLSLLLASDAESEVLAPLRLPRIDLLKVSHHGSADEGLPALLQQLQPRLAVIEVGAHNSYGHPTPATLAALSSAGVELRRTDKDGTVRIEADRTGLHVQSPT